MDDALSHDQQRRGDQTIAGVQQIEPVGAIELRQQLIDLRQSVVEQRQVEHPTIELGFSARGGQHQNQVRRVILLGE